MHDHGLSLSPLASEFLASLRAVSEAGGFTVNIPDDTALSHEQRWEAKREIRGQLGSYTVVLWTTLAMLRCNEAACHLDLSLNEDGQLVSYYCTDITDAVGTIEFVTLLAQYAATRAWLVKALHLDADPAWQARERPKVIALLRERALASKVVAPGAKKVQA